MNPVKADAGYRPLNTSIFEAVPYLLHRADDQRVRLEHDNSTFWTTRTPPGDRKMKKASLFGHDSLGMTVPQGTIETGCRRGKKYLWTIRKTRHSS
ncbi:hypothetical protein DPMN_036959 [Dreissena polymorpha]|uniref:Uncharacterized protein n=1 Tax=Dreissena polymorpha TaxID=45954 RepID=A0A9D4RPC4_DREPO|nr:hypothetical protein DPMN_036959 [Dreissena polymorpha]